MTGFGVGGGPQSVAGPPVPPATGRVVARVELLERLRAAARVTAVSGSAGSGKTVLLRSWISEAPVEGSSAWVSTRRGERDPQRFWLSVLGALRRTAPGSVLVRELTPAPDLDGWAITELLLKDLASLRDRIWLVIDDVHEIASADALGQLELLLLRAPPELRFVLAARQDVRLGLHRLRLEGDLTEIRADDLRFSLAEARDMFDAAGVRLSDVALTLLYERTEGWAAGLRLAALSLAGHDDPERFAAEFSGTERTVAEYLLAEVLDRQPADVRQLLLRTSVLERVSGPLADAMTGSPGGERILRQLEEANAFVVSLDAARSWFRFHYLFADLLQQELRRTAPEEVITLHRTASNWFAEHGLPVEAIGHAQAAQDWGMAIRLLADHWAGLQLGGQAATVHAILAAFPPGLSAADAELAVLAAADELTHGSLAAAERHLGLAARGEASVPAGRRGQAQLLLGVARLLLARQRGDLPAVAEEAEQLQAAAEAAARPGLLEELRALALISLGTVELWAARFEEAGRHLEQGVVLARWIGRPYLEFTGRAYQGPAALDQSFARSADYSRQAIELARRHGWLDEPTAGVAYMCLAYVLTWQGRLEEAEPWIERAEGTVRAEAEPWTAVLAYYVRGLIELGRGRDAAASASLRAAERLSATLGDTSLIIHRSRAKRMVALVRMGDMEAAGHVLGDPADHDRDHGETHIAMAVLRLAQRDPRAASAELAPVLDGSAPLVRRNWMIYAFLLEAIAAEASGDPAVAGRALESALDAAEADHIRLPFLLYPAPRLLERHALGCARHASQIAEILSMLPAGRGRPIEGPAGYEEMASRQPADPEGSSARLIDPLSKTELRVLRYLPTHLSRHEIADELHVSPNTVKTHMRHLYDKLGTHRRAEAVERARALGLLAPAPRTPRESQRSPMPDSHSRNAGDKHSLE